MPREEQIRAAISDMDSEVLKDTLAILLAENKISAPEQKNELRGDFQNFAQVILELKENTNSQSLIIFLQKLIWYTFRQETDECF